MRTEPDRNRLLWESRAAGEDAFAWEELGGEPTGIKVEQVDDPAGSWLRPNHATSAAAVLAIHGGGFVTGSFATHRRMFGHLASAAGTPAFCVEYGLVPEHVFPAQVETVLAAYGWLRRRGIERIGIAGDSCGATLAVSLTVRLRDAREPLPDALYLISAWADLGASGDSYDRGSDPFFTRPLVRALADGYLAGAEATDPIASPINALLDGFPPVYLQAGGEEALLDDSRALANRLIDAGVETMLEVTPGQWHTFQMGAGRSMVASEAIEKGGRWLQSKLTA